MSYRDQEWLRREYYEKERTLVEIARELGCDHTTISKWVRKFGIPQPNRATPWGNVKCLTCDKELYRRLDNPKYGYVCDVKCLHKGRSKGIIKREIVTPYETAGPTYVPKNCVVCRKEFKVVAMLRKQQTCSQECLETRRKARMRGANNPSWLDGRSYDKRCYRGDDWEKQRLACYRRDRFACQKCGVRCISRKMLNKENGHLLIQCHHVVDYKDGGTNELSNLVTFCARCHGRLPK